MSLQLRFCYHGALAAAAFPPAENIPSDSCLPSAGAWTRLSAEPRLIAPGTRISPPRDAPAGRLLLSSPKHFCVAPNPRAVDLLSTLKTQRFIPCAVSYLAFFFSPPSRLCSDGSFFLFFFSSSFPSCHCRDAVHVAWLCGNGPLTDPPLSLLLSSYSRCQLMQRRKPTSTASTLNVGSRFSNRQHPSTKRSSARSEKDTDTRAAVSIYFY